MSSVSNPQIGAGASPVPVKSEDECLADAARTYAEYLRQREATPAEVAA